MKIHETHNRGSLLKGLEGYSSVWITLHVCDTYFHISRETGREDYTE